MIKQISMPAFLRNFSVSDNGAIDLFMDSGASVQAGIPTGGGTVWEFKRELYCSDTETSLSSSIFKRSLTREPAQHSLQHVRIFE